MCSLLLKELFKILISIWNKNHFLSLRNDKWIRVVLVLVPFGQVVSAQFPGWVVSVNWSGSFRPNFKSGWFRPDFRDELFRLDIFLCVWRVGWWEGVGGGGEGLVRGWVAEFRFDKADKSTVMYLMMSGCWIPQDTSSKGANKSNLC